MVTSYSKNGKLSMFSTQFPGAQSVRGKDFTPKSLVGFHMKPRARADEAAVRGAGCKIEAVDESGSPIVLLADAHFFYPVGFLTYAVLFLSLCSAQHQFIMCTVTISHCAACCLKSC